MRTQRSTIDETVRVFHEQFGNQGDLHCGWSPGRVNLIGEYTDLNNGFVLPMAIDLGICVVARLRAKPGMTVYASKYQQSVDLSLAVAEYTDMPSWAHYVAGVAVLSQESGCEFSGFDIVVNGNLPIGGGVSSSAALCVATALAIQSATGWDLEPLATAQLCQVVEHRFAGVKCGIMDQMACRMGKADSALFIDCASYESKSVPIAPGHVELLVVDSGVPRSLHASEYNSRGNECEMAMQAIQSAGFIVENLRAVTPEMLEQAGPTMADRLLRRARHVVTENLRVLSALHALDLGRFDKLGQLMYQSHESLRDDFNVSVGELDHIVASAKDCDGVLGARLTGAGFGGNAIVMTRKGASEDVERSIRSSFAKRFDRIPQTHRVGHSNEAQGYSLNA